MNIEKIENILEVNDPTAIENVKLEILNDPNCGDIVLNLMNQYDYNDEDKEQEQKIMEFLRDKRFDKSLRELLEKVSIVDETSCFDDVFGSNDNDNDKVDDYEDKFEKGILNAKKLDVRCSCCGSPVILSVSDEEGVEIDFDVKLNIISQEGFDGSMKEYFLGKDLKDDSIELNFSCRSCESYVDAETKAKELDIVEFIESKLK